MELTNMILEMFMKLNYTEKQHIYEMLKDEMHPNDYDDSIIDEVRLSRFEDGYTCPHCASKEVVRYGKSKGKQRYKCKTCEKYFNDFTGTPMAYTHKPELWLKYMNCMIKGMSLRESAKILKVSHVTLFYWRHKILSGIKQIENKVFRDIVEADETYFLYSEKGKRKIEGRKPRKRGGASKYRGISKEQVCVLVARDRSKSTVSEVACMGRINKATIEDKIGNLISENTTLCTDAWKSYSTFALERNLAHYKLNASERKYVIKNIYHIQNVNSFHSNLKNWIKRFKGVAANI